MPVSQPLNFGDRLREALSDAQRILDGVRLEAKLAVKPELGSGGTLSAVESSMDRTAAAARDAADKSFGAEPSSPLNPTDRMVDAMERLIKTLRDADEGGGRAPSRRRRARRAEAAPEEDEAPEGGPSYVNPYLLQGLLTNPVGTTKNSLLSMLLGGAGAGIKAPSGLLSMLAGTGGLFKPGLALGSETGLVAAGGAGEFASAGLIAGAKVAVPIAAFAGTMMLQHGASKDRLGDAQHWLADRVFGRGMGLEDWRAGTWGTNYWRSRNDIFGKDVQEAVSGMGVGLNAWSNHTGSWEMISTINKAVEHGMALGLTGAQTGSLLGAGVRSGSISLQGRDAGDSVLRYLSLIAENTKEAASNGLSTAEAMQRFSELGALGSQGTNVLTLKAHRVLTSMDASIRANMPDELKRGGTKSAMDALTAQAAGDTQTVLMMNQFLGADGSLTEAGMAAANEAFGEAQTQNILKKWGPMGGTVLAHQLTQTAGGRARARSGMYRQMEGAGVSAQQAMLTLNPGDYLGGTLARDESLRGHLFPHQTSLGTTPVGGELISSRDNYERQNEVILAQYGQVMERLSGMTADTAVSMQKLGQQTTSLIREFTNLADQMRKSPWMLVPGVGGTMAGLEALSNRNR